VSWLKPFVEERDMQVFGKKLAELDRAVRVLAHRGDAKALWAVSSTVHGLATEGTQGPNTRAAKAAALLQLFTDPGMLGPVAERLLSTDDDSRDAARTLLVRAKAAGAYALYGARVKHAVHPRVRAPFVATMSAVGEGAWPVVRAALEKIPPAALTGGHPLAAELAEDLLLCVPQVRDEAAGHLVATYVRSTVPSLCRAATRALARLWAERARPLLLGLLANDDDGVRIAAIVGLSEIGAVDEHAARRIAPLATRGAATYELRIAALQALGSMTVEARPVAVPILAQVVRDPASPEDATLLAAASALVKNVGPEAHPIIRERAHRSSEPIRTQLLAFLA
jgi:serine/threonine-protein kinase